METCTVDGCGRAVLNIKRGLCRAHYRRWQRHGDPTSGRSLVGSSALDRAKARDPIPWGECLLWSGDTNNYGYGQVKTGGDTYRTRKYHMVHRLVFEEEHGPIPARMQIDHVCHNEAAARGECDGGNACIHRRCYRIDHLRLATNSENLKASVLHMGRERDNAGRFAPGPRH